MKNSTSKNYFHADNILKFVLAIGILVICASVAYYFVIFLPQKENQAIEIQKQQLELKKAEQAKTEQAKQDAQDILNSCLATATANYNDFWNRECKSLGLLTQQCNHLMEITAVGYSDENPNLKIIDAWTEYRKKKAECSCRLPSYNAERVDASQKDDIDNCYKQYNTQK
jgi:crotonobetainyl-CoA:carnitine CoA-transferase CaiB-like acyl-CoA transferase